MKIIMKRKLKENNQDNRYTFIFVRDDLHSKEYQLVQTAHVTLDLGARLSKDKIETSNLWFWVCSAKDEKHLIDIEKEFASYGIRMVRFIEPDIGNQITAIASYPVFGREHAFLKKYERFKFPIKNTKKKA